jgi:hypothetical protein
MTVETFADILAQEMEADQSTAFVDSLIKDARAAIKAGKGTIASLSNSGLNGKTFTRQVHLSAAEVLQACRFALAQYLNDGEDDTRVSSSRPDFSQMCR